MTPIDDHLARFDGAQRTSLEALRDDLRSLLPDAEECLSYRMPCFRVHGAAVAGFDGFARHCSYFPHSGNVIAHAGPYPDWCDGQGGTLRFPIGCRLPIEVVRRLVEVRMAEIAERAASGARPRGRRVTPG